MNRLLNTQRTEPAPSSDDEWFSDIATALEGFPSAEDATDVPMQDYWWVWPSADQDEEP